MPKHRAQQQPLEYRILVMGDSAVGKTSLIARYVRNEFPIKNRPRVNPDGSTVYQTVIDGSDCILMFFDISGVYDLQRFTSSDSVPTACLILFSITDPRSFSKLNHFQDAIHSQFHNQSVPIIILANKIDLEGDRHISQQSIDKLKTNGFYVIDVSVKGNVGIDDAIYTAIKYLQYEQNYQLENVKSYRDCACVVM